ncbi:hypothetical protein T12_6991, partial [Trichinella patagoniensis]
MTVFICYFRGKFPTNNAMPRWHHAKRYFYDITQHAHVHFFFQCFEICFTFVLHSRTINGKACCATKAIKEHYLHTRIRSSLFCDSSTFRFVDISPSAPMIISGTITLVTVFQFIEIP